jgi:uncharacterized protein YecT (DUF1311 family)
MGVRACGALPWTPFISNVKRLMSAKHIFIIALILWAQSTSAESGADDCSALSSHAESRSCLEKKAKRSSDKLKKSEEDLAAAIEGWGQESFWKKKSAAALKESSRSFYQHRKSQCDFKASLAAGGNGAGDMRLECTIEMNRERMARLREIMKGLQ